MNVGPKIATFKELPWNNLYFLTLLHHSSDHVLVSILKLEYVGVLSLEEWLELLLAFKSSRFRIFQKTTNELRNDLVTGRCVFFTVASRWGVQNWPVMIA